MKERGPGAGAIPGTSGDSKVTLGAEVGAGLGVHLDTQMISGAEAQAGAGVEVKATEEKELMESKGGIHMNGFTFWENFWMRIIKFSFILAFVVLLRYL